MVGIFTTKDLMRRVVAMDLDPSTCLVSRVMTPNPHSATLGTTILETLHSMHNGRFLHVPVFDEDGKLVGLVDVLQVTCGVVQQMGSFQGVKNDSVQPLWDEFRSSLVRTEESADADDGDDTQSDAESTHRDSEHTQSGSLSRTVESVLESRTWGDFQEAQQRGDGGADVTTDADPVLGDGPVMDDPVPDVFVYKLADCYGNNHRFTSSAESLKELLQDVQTRLGDHTIRRVHYVDDEGDHVRLPSSRIWTTLGSLDHCLTVNLCGVGAAVQGRRPQGRGAPRAHVGQQVHPADRAAPHAPEARPRRPRRPARVRPPRVRHGDVAGHRLLRGGRRRDRRRVLPAQPAQMSNPARTFLVQSGVVLLNSFNAVVCCLTTTIPGAYKLTIQYIPAPSKRQQLSAVHVLPRLSLASLGRRASRV